MSQEIREEIRNALWGCLEFPLYLKNGAKRFKGTIPALKRSLLVPVLLIPVIITTIPSAEIYADKDFLWMFFLYFVQIMLTTAVFASILYWFKPKTVTQEQYLQCVTTYNWLSLPAYAVNIPLLLMGALGIHTWNDIFAMMMLLILYNYSYMAYMISRTLQINVFLGASLAVIDMMTSQIVQNTVTYFMLHKI